MPQSVGAPAVVATTASTVYYSFDLRGNTTNRTVQSGTDGVIQTSAFYNAYGARGSTNYDADPYDGFGGQYGYRKDTGAAWLYLCGQRYFAPEEGRLINRSPPVRLIHGETMIHCYQSFGGSDSAGERVETS